MHENETSFHNLESPAAGVPLPPGWQRLRGWLVPKRGFHFVDVRARIGPRIFPGVYGFPRADLAAHFEPARPWLPAEWTIEIELKPGVTEVIIEALSIKGLWQPMHTAALVAEGLPAAEAKNDPLGAEEFGLALQLCLKQSHGSSGEAATNLAASLPYPPVLRPNYPPFHGYIDEPAILSPALYGRLQVLGWLFHETVPIKRAFVSTDLLAFQPLELGGEFPGVKERFPHYPHARNCRLFGFADVSSQLPAPARARFYAELEDGSVHLCLAVQCRAVVTEEIKAVYPQFSPQKFWKTSRRLRQAFGHRNLPFEGGGKHVIQLWKSFLEYRREAPPPIPSPGMDAQPGRARTTPHNLRLLLITHNLNLEGAPLLFVEYARHLAQAAGTQLLVLSGQDGPLRSAFVEMGAEVTVVDTSALLAARSQAGLRRHLAAFAKQLDWPKIDAVIANTLFSFWGVQLALAAGRPSLLYLHESTSPAAFFKGRSHERLLPAVYDALSRATAVSFNTPATQAYYQPFGSGQNFHLTPAWIDLAAIHAFRAAHPSARLRERLNLKDGELLVANVGTVCDRKGQHDFLRAIEWLWRLQPGLAGRCRFVMVGGRDTPYNRFVQESLAAMGRARLLIVPETNRVYDYFGAADLFVCTSYEESFPRVVLEAMAFEVPIVSTNVHGIVYMLRAEEDALLVNPGDTDALALAMRRALENPSEAKARAARARVRSLEFDAASILPRHAALTAAVANAQA